MTITAPAEKFNLLIRRSLTQSLKETSEGHFVFISTPNHSLSMVTSGSLRFMSSSGGAISQTCFKAGIGGT